MHTSIAHQDNVRRQLQRLIRLEIVRGTVLIFARLQHTWMGGEYARVLSFLGGWVVGSCPDQNWGHNGLVSM